MIYFCCDEKRRKAVEAKPGLNGIDFLEVLDSEALPLDQRQRTLFVHFLKAAGLPALKPENIRIEGGERIRDVAATKVTVDAAAPKVLAVTVNQPGDFSTYTLRLSAFAHRPGAAGWLRSAALGGGLLLQGRMPDRLRLQAGAGLPAGDAARAGDQLPGQRLRQLPPADARPAGQPDARLGRAQPGRPGRDAGRAAGLRRRPPELPAGRHRHRGLSRHGAAPRSRCAATPGWWTTSCTTAATRARGCTCGWTRPTRPASGCACATQTLPEAAPAS